MTDYYWQWIGDWQMAISDRRVETLRSYLQLAMMADAAAESLRMVRFCDTDDMPIEDLSFEIGAFIKRICLMFVEGKVTSINGYTAFAIQNLKHLRLMRTKGGTKTFGGDAEPSAETITKCLQHMAGWSKLAIAIMETEFPAYEIFQAFDVFSLASKRHTSEMDTVQS